MEVCIDKGKPGLRTRVALKSEVDKIFIFYPLK